MSTGTAAIQFHYQYRSFSLPARTELKAFLLRLARTEKQKIEQVNYIFCSDEYLLQLNRSYLNHDTLTDIITFPFNSPGQPLVSDIYISIERVRENAGLFNSSLNRELHRVIFHGLLHLCGYKDKTKDQALLMRNKEETYLNKYFVPRGTT